MKTLLELYNKHYDPKTGWPDKNSVHSYIEVYEEILKPYRHINGNVLEIGLMSGESLRMWDEYFDYADVHGIDCSETPIDGKADLRPMIKEGFLISIGDATNKDDIKRFYNYVKFDVVIDDGSHNTCDQLKTYNILENYMAEGGVYIIEDPQQLDEDKEKYIALHKSVEIIDRRSIKNRYDDSLILIRF